ncbi:olfactory receptor-like protein OLF4 [Pelobates fuscus]|uniref:olfactory receptor-like protein OLF4 n=1 Tax=Pelobates fuscus TaxID=191477 RepID=UPI002FE4DCEE
MDNQTANPEEFYILAFSYHGEIQPYLFVLFLAIYLCGLIGNLAIITVISLIPNLHTPMYFFLCNLSLVDLFYTTTILPKLMHILITGDNKISFLHCFTQMYFYTFMASTEIMLLSLMAYDRYVAICYPLHYQLIMNWKKCIRLAIGNWILECCNSSFFAVFASTFSFCQTKEIHHFCCDTKALGKIACSNKSFQIMIFIETLLFGPFPLLLSLSSYIKIVSSILQIKSIQSRRKAFSTCGSHLTVLLMFYMSVLCTYMRPTLEHSETLDQIFSVLYTAVTPMLNPIIYSFRNKEVKEALKKVVRL